MTSLSQQDYRTLARFRHVLRVFQEFSDRAAQDAGVTPRHHQLLLSIQGHPADVPPTIGDLAEALRLRHHSVVELVDRGESAGLVKREPDPDDHRRQRVIATPAGLEVLERLTAVHRQELRRFRTTVLDVLQDLD